MKVGFVVDGVSEFASLGELYAQLEALCGHHLLRPARADIQPYAPVGVIVRQCRSKVTQSFARGATRVVVLVDFENRDGCPGQHASEIERGLAASIRGEVCVVVKNRAFENWVIADIDAVNDSPRFHVSNATIRSIRPNRADGVEALRLLKRACEGGAYDKVKDSKAILARADPEVIASNSRSFRRLMRVVGCASYGTQSEVPGRGG